MFYVAIFLLILVVFILFLVWLRKVQFDAVQRNFLDLADRYNGKIVRHGFAARPRISGKYNDIEFAISISAERKTKNKSRLFYISLYFQSKSHYNFTILSQKWLKPRSDRDEKKRYTKSILDNHYLLEVTDLDLLKILDFPSIEKILDRLSPIAYALVSKKAIILERISDNLIKDTEFEKLKNLLQATYDLSNLSAVGNE